MAALMGFCGVSNWRDIPDLYVILKDVKVMIHARNLIRQGIEAWSTKNGIEIYESIYLSEELIKNIWGIKPNPTETVGILKVSDVAVTKHGLSSNVSHGDWNQTDQRKSSGVYRGNSHEKRGGETAKKAAEEATG